MGISLAHLSPNQLNTRGISFLLKAIAILLIIIAFSSAPAAAQNAGCDPTIDETCVSSSDVTAGGSQTGGNPQLLADNASCYTCELFLRLESVGSVFVANIYDGIAPSLRNILTTLASIYIILLALMAMAKRISGGELTKKVVTFVVIAVIADRFLANGYSMYEHWIVEPMLDSAATYANFIIDTAKSLQTSSHAQSIATFPTFTIDSNAGMFAKLMAVVEGQVWGFIRIAGSFLQAQGGWFANPAGLVLIMILILAFIFILLIFTAFMVEALFKVLSVGFIAPVLIMFVAFPMTRAITWAALRILLGACLTVVFASGALGFTAAIVNDYVNSMSDAFTHSGAVECTGIDAYSVVQIVSENVLNQKPCIRVMEIWSKDFLIFYVIGFVSILLHLQSKSLASNLSGANDGVGPAAATVAAGKAGVGLALAAGSGALFGQGGARSFINSGGGGQAAAALAQHGVVGNIMNGIQNMKSGGPAQFVPESTQPYSTGGGSAPQQGGSMFADRKQMQEFAKILSDTLKPTPTRDRSGSG